MNRVPGAHLTGLTGFAPATYNEITMELDDHAKELMKQLGAAINESLSESESVSAAMNDIREAGYDVLVGRFPFSASARAQTSGETEGLVKVVADSKYGEILGVHIIGADASEMIPESALALKLEATLEDIAATIHAHPTLAEATMEAALAATGQSIHLPRPRR